MIIKHLYSRVYVHFNIQIMQEKKEEKPDESSLRNPVWPYKTLTRFKNALTDVSFLSILSLIWFLEFSSGQIIYLSESVSTSISRI